MERETAISSSVNNINKDSKFFILDNENVDEIVTDKELSFQRELPTAFPTIPRLPPFVLFDDRCSLAAVWTTMLGEMSGGLAVSITFSLLSTEFSAKSTLLIRRYKTWKFHPLRRLSSLEIFWKSLPKVDFTIFFFFRMLSDNCYFSNSSDLNIPISSSSLSSSFLFEQ